MYSLDEVKVTDSEVAAAIEAEMARQNSPIPYAHVTTNKAVFPGIQGGPLMLLDLTSFDLTGKEVENPLDM